MQLLNCQNEMIIISETSVSKLKYRIFTISHFAVVNNGIFTHRPTNLRQLCSFMNDIRAKT